MAIMIKTDDSSVSMSIERVLMLKNFWEVYITDEETDDPRQRFALVMGFENELGYVWLPEYDGHIICDTKGSSLEQMVRDGEICPATGWYWQAVGHYRLDQEAAA
tara:strand:- start:477 stop:791 length:315 start_codon:yes stop_codon:yes gene_type:complete